MTMRKVAFWAGFTAVSLFLVIYLIILGNYFLIPAINGEPNIFLVIFWGTLGYMGPVAIATIALFMGKNNPLTAGYAEMGLGGLGFLLGLGLLLQELRLDSLWNSSSSLLKPFMIFSIVGGGILLLVSGFMFWYSTRNEKQSSS